jgi:outer membrane protein TolC
MVRNEVLLSTEEQYWRVVALDQKLKTVARYEAFLNRLQVKVESAYQAGLATKNDVLKVKMKLSELMVNKSKLQNGREISAMALCQYIGIPYNPKLELEETPPYDGAPDSFKADHQAALPKRPEYKLFEAAVRSERLQSKLKLGEFLPQAGIGLAGIYMKTDDAKETTNGLIYGTISIPLSGWWEASHAMSERKTREKIAQNNLKDRSEALLIQMEKAWQDLNDADTGPGRREPQGQRGQLRERHERRFRSFGSPSHETADPGPGVGRGVRLPAQAGLLPAGDGTVSESDLIFNMVNKIYNGDGILILIL